MPYSDPAKYSEYQRNYQREYYHRRKHEERVLLGRPNTTGKLAKRLPAPTRPEPSHCELCGGEPKTFKGLVLDHDHETGAFRGWLCNPCNLVLGRAGDRADKVAAWADKALAYLAPKE